MPDTIRVLYVDDEPALLEIGKRFLELSENLSVITIVSAPAALGLLYLEKFDAIVFVRIVGRGEDDSRIRPERPGNVRHAGGR